MAPKPSRLRSAPPGPAAPVRDARSVMFPRGREVPLQNGTTVTVRPWSIRLLVLVSQRLPERMTEMIQGVRSEAAAITLLPKAVDELRYLAAETLGLPEAEIDDQWSAEDLLDVSLAIWDVCIQPVAEKIMGLAARVQGTTTPPLTPTPVRPSLPPSST